MEFNIDEITNAEEIEDESLTEQHSQYKLDKKNLIEFFDTDCAKARMIAHYITRMI